MFLSGACHYGQCNSVNSFRPCCFFPITVLLTAFVVVVVVVVGIGANLQSLFVVVVVVVVVAVVVTVAAVVVSAVYQLADHAAQLISSWLGVVLVGVSCSWCYCCWYYCCCCCCC